MLSHLEDIKKDEHFYISSITIEELEDIKTSKHKDDEVKYNARKATRWLFENQDKYDVIISKNSIHDITNETTISPDVEIISCAHFLSNQLKDVELTFVSNDILALLIAKNEFGLNVSAMADTTDEMYKGYIDVTMSDEELAKFYENQDQNFYNLSINQYIVIHNTADEVVDVLRWNGDNYSTLTTKNFKSKLLGVTKPFDDIQKCAFDSLHNNDITVLYGKAGSGKTTIPLSYAMQMVESGKFSKIYFVYSFQPLKGQPTLGFEKGTHLEKLCNSASIGNILGMKLGSISMLETLIDENKIDIIPTANIRGVEFPSDACVIVTEAQNLDTYTLKTIIQRCKAGCKQIYEGDIIEQKDVNIQSPGIERMIDIFKGHQGFGCIKLKYNYRSEFCSLADEL